MCNFGKNYNSYGLLPEIMQILEMLNSHYMVYVHVCMSMYLCYFLVII